MKILIACEFSGLVTEAFRKRGHDVLSCDLRDSEIEGKHYKGNVIDKLYDGWDLMIGFPPCTYLSFVGKRYWDYPGRIKQRIEALEFFRILWEAPIEKICLENPLGIASQVITKHHQVIEPYFFGNQFKKTTCLWLKNLPLLQHEAENNLFTQKTHTDLPKPIYKNSNGKNIHFVEATSNKKERERFWPGIANAMAEQWG